MIVPEGLRRNMQATRQLIRDYQRDHEWEMNRTFIALGASGTLAGGALQFRTALMLPRIRVAEKRVGARRIDLCQGFESGTR